MKASEITVEELARLTALRNDQMWWPQPGPQLDAYQCQADILLYGGAAGAGKTDLAIGLALTAHQKSIIFRRDFPQLAGINDRLTEILGSRDKYSGQEKSWRISKHRSIELGSFTNPGDETKYQGRPHDLIIFDEVANLREDQVRFCMGWNRSVDPEQRCRVLMCSNPPTDTDGMWLLDYFAPWLNPDYPDLLNRGPAKHGELRWFVTMDGRDVEVAGPEPFKHKGERLRPQSRSFIPGRVWDNAFLADTGYVATLQALPEPLRSAMLHGDFLAARQDNEWQVIPSAWIMEAQGRWKPKTAAEILQLQLTSVGVDVARGGADESVIATRYGWYFTELKVIPGRDTPRSGDLAGLVLDVCGNIAPVHIDTIGVGAAVVDMLDGYIGHRAIPVNVSERADYKDFTNHLKFVNKRAELWWRMRDLLDPMSPVKIALPPDRKLLADLSAPRYSMKSTGIQIESKEQLQKRIGRSPDRADAVILAAIRTPLMRDLNARPRVLGTFS